MAQRPSRRSFLGTAPVLAAFGIASTGGHAWAQPGASASTLQREVFPAQDPAVVKEVVGASHRDLARVRELVERQPALARAAIDWGFGDWESCIDAASHVGNRPIAEFLLAHGARPTLFSAAMLGQLDVVKACIVASPGIQRTLGPHGLTLMWHARQGRAEAQAVVDYLTDVGDADVPLPTAPLAAGERESLAGSYAYGTGPRDYLTVESRRDQLGRDQVVMERPGSPARQNLFHVGNLVFFPTGVPSARIAFGKTGDTVSQLTIADPDVMLTARRR